MQWKVTTPPTFLPVSVAEAKENARIDTDADDTVVANKLEAAVDWLQRHLRRQFCTATITLKFDSFSACELDETGAIRPPMPPLIAVTSLSYRDTDGDTVALVEGTDFIVDAYSEPGRIVLAVDGDETWPDVYGDANDVTIVYTAGYGGPKSVPHPIKQGVLLSFGWLYQNREPTGMEWKCIDALTADFRMEGYV